MSERREEVVQLWRVTEDALQRLTKAEKEVPRDEGKCKELRRELDRLEVARQGRATGDMYERLARAEAEVPRDERKCKELLLERKWHEAYERLVRAEAEVPRDELRCKRLLKAFRAAVLAHERLKNDWFPPEYADCVDGFDMYMGYGPNHMKIRPKGSRGKWRPYPRDPLDEPPANA